MAQGARVRADGAPEFPKVKPQIKRRCALTAAVSKDDGVTFGEPRHIARDPEDDFGYQCVTFLPDNTALIGYHARTGIAWFYGG